MDGGRGAGGVDGLEGLESLRAWTSRSERWIYWGLGFAAALGAMLGGLAMVLQQWRGRPSRWPPGTRRLRLAEPAADEQAAQ